MGNGPSVFLAKEVKWEEYAVQEWRSDISKDLDGLGGLDRPPIARGLSFTRKLALLESALNKHGTELERFFMLAPSDGGRAGPKDRAARRAKLKIPELLSLKQGPQVVAPWRLRVHASRRRAILVVRSMVRLMRGKVRVAPVPRLDRFDFAIYAALGGEWIRVAEEQQRYMLLRDQVEAATVALEDAIAAATVRLERSRASQQQARALPAPCTSPPGSNRSSATSIGSLNGWGGRRGSGSGASRGPSPTRRSRHLSRDGGIPDPQPNHHLPKPSTKRQSGADGVFPRSPHPDDYYPSLRSTNSSGVGAGFGAGGFPVHPAMHGAFSSAASVASVGSGCGGSLRPTTPVAGGVSPFAAPHRATAVHGVAGFRSCIGGQAAMMVGRVSSPGTRGELSNGFDSWSTMMAGVNALRGRGTPAATGRMPDSAAMAPFPDSPADGHRFSTNSAATAIESRNSAASTATSYSTGTTLSQDTIHPVSSSEPVASMESLTSAFGEDGMYGGSVNGLLPYGLYVTPPRKVPLAEGDIVGDGGFGGFGCGGGGSPLPPLHRPHEPHGKLMMSPASSDQGDGVISPGPVLGVTASRAMAPSSPVTPPASSGVVATPPDREIFGSPGPFVRARVTRKPPPPLELPPPVESVGALGSISRVGGDGEMPLTPPAPCSPPTGGSGKPLASCPSRVVAPSPDSSSGLMVVMAPFSQRQQLSRASGGSPVPPSGPSSSPLHRPVPALAKPAWIAPSAPSAISLHHTTTPQAPTHATYGDLAPGGATSAGCGPHPVKPPPPMMVSARLRAPWEGPSGGGAASGGNGSEAGSETGSEGASSLPPLAQATKASSGQEGASAGPGAGCGNMSKSVPRRPASKSGGFANRTGTGSGSGSGGSGSGSGNGSGGMASRYPSPLGSKPEPGVLGKVPALLGAEGELRRRSTDGVGSGMEGGGGGGSAVARLQRRSSRLAVRASADGSINSRSYPATQSPLRLKSQPIQQLQQQQQQPQRFAGVMSSSGNTPSSKRNGFNSARQNATNPTTAATTTAPNAFTTGADAAPPASPRPPPAPPGSHVSRALAVLQQAGSYNWTERYTAAAIASYAPVPSSLQGAAGGGHVSATAGFAYEEAEAARIESLRMQCQERLEELHRCSQLISVFLNRGNAAWAEGQAWGPPPMVNQLQLAAFARSETGLVFRSEIARLLRCGAIAVHLRAADDFLEPGILRSGSNSVNPAAAAAAVYGGSRSDLGGGGEPSSDPSAHFSAAGKSSGRWPNGGSGSGSMGVGVFPAAPAAGSSLLPGLMYRSEAPDLWTLDPWRVLEIYRPGIVPNGGRLEGLSLGCRYVASLVLAVEAAAGREAVARLPLVLVVGEGQADEAVRQLWAYRFFGIPRDNVLVLVQPSHPGYTYDSAGRTWNQGDVSHSLPLGSGYGLMQLTWRGEALRVTEEGCLAPLSLSALVWMEARGVSWMISRRARDLGLLTKNGVLDVNSLSYGLYYHTDRSPSTNMILEAAPTTSLLLTRVLDSVIMARRVEGGAATQQQPTASSPTTAHAANGTTSSSCPKAATYSSDMSGSRGPSRGNSSGSGSSGGGSSLASLDSLPAPSAPQPLDGVPALPSAASVSTMPLQPLSPVTSLADGANVGDGSNSSGGGGGAGGVTATSPPAAATAPTPPSTLQVVELCLADLGTPAMRSVLEDYQSSGRVVAGLGRYMMHLPSITQMLAGRLSVLRPKLGLVDDLLHVRLEVADITSAPTAASLLLQARPETPQLLVYDDVDALLPLLQAQDSNSRFRQLVLSCRDAPATAGGVPGALPAPSPRVGPCLLDPIAQRIVVFVTQNEVSAAAVSMAASVALPGRDSVTFATIVPDATLHRQRANELLARHAATFEKRCGAVYGCEVVGRNSYGLLDCLENFAVQQCATMVIMGSNALTSTATVSTSSSAAISLGSPTSPHPANSSTLNVRKSSFGSASGNGEGGDGAKGFPGLSVASFIQLVSSATCALLRRLPMPLLLVTRASATAAASAAAAAAAGPGREHDGHRRPLRVMAVLDGEPSAGMVDFLASKVCNPRGGDQLYLSYVRRSSNTTQQQQANVRALMGRYSHQLSAHGMRPASTLLLDPPAETAIATAATTHGIDLLALPAVPRGRPLPPTVVACMRASGTAVLWYREGRGDYEQRRWGLGLGCGAGTG